MCNYFPMPQEIPPEPSGSLVQGMGVDRPSLQSPGGRAEERRQAGDPAQLAWDKENDPEVMVPYLRYATPRMVEDRLGFTLSRVRRGQMSPMVVRHAARHLRSGRLGGAINALGLLGNVGDVCRLVCRVVRSCVPEVPEGYRGSHEATTEDQGGGSEAAGGPGGVGADA